jgi:hypothetical protein
MKAIRSGHLAAVLMGGRTVFVAVLMGITVPAPVSGT